MAREKTLHRIKGIGDSNWPLVRDGSALDVEGHGSRPPARGDLVVFLRGDLPVCHRVLAVSRRPGEPARYLLKGDANLHADGWFAETAVLGRVVRVNGRPVDRFPFRALSAVAGANSLVQWRIASLVFASPWGRKLDAAWKRRITTRPVVTSAVTYVLAPWLLARPLARWLGGVRGKGTRA